MPTPEQAAQQLAVLGKRLKQAGEGGLRKELLAGIRASAKPTIAKIRESALTELPGSGGLAALVAASKFGARTRLTGSSARVTITGVGRNVRNLRLMNSGRVRHPVFARGDDRHGWTWVNQRVTAGWFDRPIEQNAPQIRAAIDTKMREVARKIEGAL